MQELEVQQSSSPSDCLKGRLRKVEHEGNEEVAEERGEGEEERATFGRTVQFLLSSSAGKAAM